MAPFDVDPVAAELYAALEPLAYADEENDYALLALCEALTAADEEIASWVRDTAEGPGWSNLLDVNRAPDKALRWLGQFVGVTVKQSLTAIEQRQQVRDKEGWERGRPSAIRRAARRAGPLTGTQTVEIVERDTSAYHFAAFTYTAEMPAKYTLNNLYNDYPTLLDVYLAFPTLDAILLLSAEARIERAIQLTKPAGVQFTYATIAGSPATAAWTLLSVYLQFATLQDVWNRFETLEDLYVGI